MSLIDRIWFKVLFGLFLGLPATAVLGIMSYAGFVGGLFLLFTASQPGASGLAAAVGLALFGLAGLLGIAGGWMRLCIPSAKFAASRKLRMTTAAFIVGGIAAAVTFIVVSIGGPVHTYIVPVALFSCVALIGLWLLWITIYPERR